MALPRSTRRCRIEATIIGVVVGGLLLGLLGAQHGNTCLGACEGVALGGVVGYCAEVGVIGSVTICAAIFAVFFVIFAAGCDETSGLAALPGSAFGTVLGWFWRKRPPIDTTVTRTDSESIDA